MTCRCLQTRRPECTNKKRVIFMWTISIDKSMRHRVDLWKADIHTFEKAPLCRSSIDAPPFPPPFAKPFLAKSRILSASWESTILSITTRPHFVGTQPIKDTSDSAKWLEIYSVHVAIILSAIPFYFSSVKLTFVS